MIDNLQRASKSFYDGGNLTSTMSDRQYRYELLAAAHRLNPLSRLATLPGEILKSSISQPLSSTSPQDEQAWKGAGNHSLAS